MTAEKQQSNSIATGMRSDRTWPLPSSPWVMRMTWSELLFAHWSFAPDAVALHLPEGVELDVRDGRAWVGVVPFLMSKVAPRFFPPLPFLSRFPELNVRTYVIVNGKPGVWFFSLDATNKVAVRVARAMFHLPYMDAKMSLGVEDETAIRYDSVRTHRGEPKADFSATYQKQGEPFEALPGTLEHWLTARYCLYSANKKGTIYRGEIDHPPWTLYQAACDITRNTMGENLGFSLKETPHLLFADPVKVRAWPITRCTAP